MLVPCSSLHENKKKTELNWKVSSKHWNNWSPSGDKPGRNKCEYMIFLAHVDIRLQFSSLFDPRETADETKICVAEIIFFHTIIY